MPSTSFQHILDTALADYTKQIGVDPAEHPLADQLKTCNSPDDVFKLLGDKAKEFKEYREGNRKFIDCLNPVVTSVHALSGVLGGAASLVGRIRYHSCSHFYQSIGARFRSRWQMRSSLASMFSVLFVPPIFSDCVTSRYLNSTGSHRC